MVIQQTIIHNIKLPNFLISFKEKCNDMIIPHLIQLKNFINQKDTQSTLHPIVLIITIVLVLYMIQAILKGLFGESQSNKSTGNKNYNESQQLARELNDLKKQLKSLYTSFGQLSKQLLNKKNQSNKKLQQISEVSVSKNDNIDDQISNLWRQFVPLYNISIENNKKLALYILQTQEEVLRELKRFKKSSRLSTSSDRPPMRSKTSDRKLISAELSTQRKTQNFIPQKESLTQNLIETKNKQSLILSSSSSLSTTLPQNNHSISSNITTDNNQIIKATTVIRRTIVTQSNQLKNVKPPLSKIPKIQPKNSEENKQIKNQEKILIKRSQELIKTQKKNQNEQKIELNSNEKTIEAQIEQIDSQIKQPIIQETKIKIQSPFEMKKQVRKMEQQNLHVQKITSDSPQTNQNENLSEMLPDSQIHVISQPIVPPKLLNLKKLNPPGKMNAARKAPPPPPRR